MLTLKNELIALGNSLMTSEEITKYNKGLVVQTTKVLMESETYPHFKKSIN